MKNNVLALIIIALIAGNAGYTHYRFNQIKGQILGVAALHILTNSTASNLYTDFTQAASVKDKDTRELLTRRVVGRYLTSNENYKGYQDAKTS